MTAFIRNLNGDGPVESVIADTGNQPRVSFGSGYEFDAADEALFAAENAWLRAKADPETGRVSVVRTTVVDKAEPGRVE